jgi:hypothetical protein
MYEFLDILTDIITFIVLGIIFNYCYKLVNIIYKIIAINIKKIYGRIKLYYYPIIPMENDIELNRIYKYAVGQEYDKLYLHIVNTICDENANKYIDYINLHLSMYKNKIIEYIIDRSISNTDINKYYESINSFLLCYSLDYKYTKKIIYKYEKNNNMIINILYICISIIIAKPYTNKIKELEEKYNILEKKNNILEDHIKYQPEGELFFELMDSFNKKIK